MAAHPPPPRTRSARLTLVSLLLVPLLSLVGLWALAASITLGNVIRYQNYKKIDTTIAPGITALSPRLMAERALTLTWLSTGRQTPETQLLAARRGTDAAVEVARRELEASAGQVTPNARPSLNAYLAALASLHRIRAAVDSGADSPVAAFNAYSAIGTAEYQFFHISTPPSDPTLSLMTQAAVASTRATDMIGGAISLISGALAARGHMPLPERALFSQVVGQQNLEVGDTLVESTPAERATYNLLYDSPVYRQFVSLENSIQATPVNRPIPVDPRSFQAMAGELTAAMQKPQVATLLAAQSSRLSNDLVTQLILGGGLGLVAVAVSVFVAVRFGRRLRGDLTSLYESARQMAGERLPRLVERLRKGEDVDVEAESPPLDRGRITEIARVADAFSSVQRTAIDAAVGQANLRKGVNQVFLSLSLRNQSLLHRQLGILDTMERATNDPAALADLFRLDHLTTRMRRHAEGLIILSGATPGRGWREPVPVVDVLRAAIAEVEDYVRVDVVSEATDALAGIAVGDVIHLLAELIENATAYSPPNTRVEVRGDAVGNGFAIEIEDRGLGLTPDELASINAQLANPPEFDLAKSDQLGLFVAGQLAARHGIRVSLRPSPFGGTTAIVVLPHDIIVRDAEAAGWAGPGGKAAGAVGAFDGLQRPGAASLTGRHRFGPALPGPVDQRDPGGPALAPVPPALAPAPLERAEVVLARSEPPEPEPGDAAWPAPGWSPAGAVVDGGTHRGLPRRVRQASLAPQLRGQSAGAGATATSEPAGSAAPSPEQLRSRLSSMQDGWQRGRVDDLDYPATSTDIWGGGSRADSSEPGVES
jgi:signal transduction histidine kinase